MAEKEPTVSPVVAETSYRTEVDGTKFKAKLLSMGRISIFIIERDDEQTINPKIEITGLTSGFSGLLEQAGKALKQVGQ